MEISRTWVSVAQELESVRILKKMYEEREEALRNDLISMQGGISHAEGKYAMFKESAKGSVKYALVPHLAGVDLDPYRGNPVVRWLFKVME
jgi:hypothetical protein